MNEFMDEAYKLALKAYKKKEIPVGAVIVKNNKIIAKACNNRQKKFNVLGHAEINAILKAEKRLKDWRLDGCDMYVTLEPCKMCESVIKEVRLDNVYYLLKNNSNEHIYVQTKDCNIKETYEKMLTKFFQEMR